MQRLHGSHAAGVGGIAPALASRMRRTAPRDRLPRELALANKKSAVNSVALSDHYVPGSAMDDDTLFRDTLQGGPRKLGQHWHRAQRPAKKCESHLTLQRRTGGQTLHQLLLHVNALTVSQHAEQVRLDVLTQVNIKLLTAHEAKQLTLLLLELRRVCIEAGQRIGEFGNNDGLNHDSHQTQQQREALFQHTRGCRHGLQGDQGQHDVVDGQAVEASEAFPEQVVVALEPQAVRQPALPLANVLRQYVPYAREPMTGQHQRTRIPQHRH
mmetsp:Transcript_29427/g.75357  ORF Transcript_29427/g.75357 Transcript_29427/m.75357 type:complete len:269 (+) Transcript_29427:2842-3648(+)